MKENHDHWARTAARLRAAGAVEVPQDQPPPPGFATRVAARAGADRRVDRGWLVRWGSGAATLACAGYAVLVLAVDRPPPQFLPLPEPDLPEAPITP